MLLQTKVGEVSATICDVGTNDIYIVGIVNATSRPVYLLQEYFDMTFLDSVILEPTVTRAGVTSTYYLHKYEAPKMFRLKSGDSVTVRAKKDASKRLAGKNCRYFIRVYDIDFANYVLDTIGGVDVYLPVFIQFEKERSQLVEAKQVSIEECIYKK